MSVLQRREARSRRHETAPPRALRGSGSAGPQQEPPRGAATGGAWGLHSTAPPVRSKSPLGGQRREERGGRQSTTVTASGTRASRRANCASATPPSVSAAPPILIAP